VLQGGDVTRFDGSGGESVCECESSAPSVYNADSFSNTVGGSMTDPKPPHAKHDYGTLSMASGSSKNSSTSQFFISLAKAGSPEATKKLDGKYYVFGHLVEGAEVLRKLEVELDQCRKERGVKGDNPGMTVWIEDCGLSA
jgi:cyclophilin family peptidyl-prolyl cis-trans isomerase